MATPWNTTTAAKDGSRIVAIGRTIYSDGALTTVDPFCAVIAWQKTESGFEGWMLDSGLSLVRSLDEEVYVDFWLEYPTAEQAAKPSAAAGA